AQRVETAVVGAEEDVAAIERDRALHGAAGVERPDGLPVDRAEAVDVPLGVADVDPVTDDERRRLAGSEVLAPAEAVGGPRSDDKQLSVSPLGRIPAARMPVQERLVDRAATEPVDRRRGRLAAADVHGPEPEPVPRGDGDQVPSEGRV